jgi:hypothetical protein
LVFKEGMERLGINLVPRVSLKKTHFQLPLNDASKYFSNIEVPSKHGTSFSAFIDYYSARTESRTNISIESVTAKEKYLQALLKKALELTWEEIAQSLGIKVEGAEFLSEQTVHGGEADILILHSGGAKEILIEVKNGPMLMANGSRLMREGQDALSQVKSYRSILMEQGSYTLGIAGKRNHNDNSLRLYHLADALIFEIDCTFPVDRFS